MIVPDRHLLHSYGECGLIVQIQLLQKELFEIKRSDGEIVCALKEMRVTGKIESSNKAIEANSPS